MLSNNVRINIILVSSVCSIAYVTGYWRTDHNVTLGQLHFIGPANSHTHTLAIHAPLHYWAKLTGLLF